MAPWFGCGKKAVHENFNSLVGRTNTPNVHLLCKLHFDPVKDITTLSALRQRCELHLVKEGIVFQVDEQLGGPSVGPCSRKRQRALGVGVLDFVILDNATPPFPRRSRVLRKGKCSVTSWATLRIQ